MSETSSSLQTLSESDRQLVRQRVADFEQGWSAGRLSALAKEPTLVGPLRPVLLLELVKVDQKKQWQRGLRVPVETYLIEYPELATVLQGQLQLAVHEFTLRQEAGAPASVADFLHRFPEQADALRERLGPSAATRPTDTTPPEEPEVAKIDTVRPDIAVAPTPQGPVGQELPRQFGRYKLLRTLGQGGMGAVYLAHDTQLDRPIALKVPFFTSTDGPEVLARFYREARSAATLNHPNICPLYDVGENDGTPYLTMAYIEGQPLGKLMKPNQPVSQRWAAQIISRMAGAMFEAHQKGIIHRDLKPANVIIDQRGEPIIMDFGVARRLTESTKITQSGGMVGTPEYMAPEQVLADEKSIGPGCDIYSVGVILYKMLSGRAPFEGTVGLVLSSIVTEDPKPPSEYRPGVDPRLEAIVQKAMARKISERYTSMADLARDLDAMLAEGNVPDDGPGSARVSVARAGPPLKALASRTGLTDTPVTLPPPKDWASAPTQPSGGRRLVVATLIVVILSAAAAGVVVILNQPQGPGTPTKPQANVPRSSMPAVPPTTAARTTTAPVVTGPTAREQYDQGLEAFKKRQYDPAIAAFDEAIRLDPKFGLAHIQRGRAYAAKGDFIQASVGFTAALAIPAYRTGETYRERAAAYEELQKDTEAAEDYAAAVKLDAGDALAHLGLARIRLRQKNPEGAIDEAEAARQSNSKLAGAHLVLGQAHSQQDRSTQALEAFTEALKLDDQLVPAYLGRGELLRAQGKLDAALEDFSKAGELAPKNVDTQARLQDVYHRLGLRYFKTRDYDKAIAFFSARLRQLEAVMKPALVFEIGAAHAEVARARQLTNRPGELNAAIEDYTKALKCNPDDSFSLLHRGDAQAQLEKYAEADTDLEKALKLNPHDVRTAYLLAHLRLLLNDPQAYRMVCRAVWKEFGQTKEPTEANQVVWLLVLEPDCGVPAKSVVGLAERSVAGMEKSPNYANYLNTLGAALFRAGDFPKAVKRLTEANEARSNKDNAIDDWLFLAMTQARLGNTAEARKWLDRASKWIDAVLKEKPKEGTAPLSWSRRMELQLLRKEAEALVKSGGKT
jgi:serine/threonine protein kinase/tetratricopeptide (TPR) repeat protein